MKFFSFGLVLVVLALAIPLGFARSPASLPDIPGVEHCALVANPALYDGKEIRVRGIYTVCGKNDSKFFSSACSDGNSVWVEFDPTYETCSKPKAIKLLSELTRKSGARWGRPHVTVIVVDYRAAEVEFVGKFSARNPYKQPEQPPPPDFPWGPILSNRERADSLFSVSCIESFRPLPKNSKY